jgi:hypothetical protein
MRVYASTHLKCNGVELRFANKILAAIVPDPEFPKMYRVKMPGRKLFDMVNLSRAKDAEVGLALANLNRQEAA